MSREPTETPARNAGRTGISLPGGRGMMAVAIAAGITAAALAAPAKERPREEAARLPVVIELFTSEGCSSCPPADEVLASLVATQPLAGAEILALGEHVDYWDDLGWRDPFSSRSFTERQSAYNERVFHLGSVYTPEMVVDGREEIIGSDKDAALAAVKKALHRPEGRLRVTLDLRRDPPDGTITVTASVAAPPNGELAEEAEVLLALTEDGLESRVRGGENGGRLLRHSAVVRSLRSLGVVRAGAGEWSGTSRLELPLEVKRGASRIVVFVQERNSRRIVGASSASLAGG